MCHKNPQKPYFCSAQMVPQEVVQKLTLEVVQKLTLARPKGASTETTLRSETISQLTPQKIFRAMITRISRNPARNNSSATFWRNDIKGHCANRFLEACYKNSKKAESNNKIAQSPQKQFPKSYFTQSIATISRNPSENNSSIIFSRAQCFLNGG